jgi:Peptidase_C39 like family
MRRLTLLIALTALLFGGAPASADGPVPQSDREPLSDLERARADDKSAVAKRYAAHKRAGGTYDQFKTEILALELRLNGGLPLPGGVSDPNRRGGPKPGHLKPSASHYGSYQNYLTPTPTWQYQQTNYYCGPASAWIALTRAGAGNSYLGQSLTQGNLAASGWLNTSSSSGTGLGANWTWTLNGWSDGTSSGWYVVDWAPSSNDVEVQVQLNIDNGFVPVLDVWMNATYGYLHSGYQAYGQVWHYVAGYGYHAYGYNVYYIDPWSVVQPGPQSDTAVLFASLMQSHGMIW